MQTKRKLVIGGLGLLALMSVGDAGLTFMTAREVMKPAPVVVESPMKCLRGNFFHALYERQDIVFESMPSYLCGRDMGYHSDPAGFEIYNPREDVDFD